MSKYEIRAVAKQCGVVKALWPVSNSSPRPLYYITPLISRIPHLAVGPTTQTSHPLCITHVPVGPNWGGPLGRIFSGTPSQAILLTNGSLRQLPLISVNSICLFSAPYVLLMQEKQCLLPNPCIRLYLLMCVIHRNESKTAPPAPRMLHRKVPLKSGKLCVTLRATYLWFDVFVEASGSLHL